MKKKKKKAGGGGGGGKASPAPQKKKEDDGLDEIDRALKELAVKNKGKGGSGGKDGAAGGREEEESIWRVEPKWMAVKEVRPFSLLQSGGRTVALTFSPLAELRL